MLFEGLLWVGESVEPLHRFSTTNIQCVAFYVFTCRQIFIIQQACLTFWTEIRGGHALFSWLAFAICLCHTSFLATRFQREKNSVSPLRFIKKMFKTLLYSQTKGVKQKYTLYISGLVVYIQYIYNCSSQVDSHLAPGGESSLCSSAPLAWLSPPGWPPLQLFAAEPG